MDGMSPEAIVSGNAGFEERTKTVFITTLLGLEFRFDAKVALHPFRSGGPILRWILALWN